MSNIELLARHSIGETLDGRGLQGHPFEESTKCQLKLKLYTFNTLTTVSRRRQLLHHHILTYSPSIIIQQLSICLLRRTIS